MSAENLRSDVAAWVRKAEEDRGMALSVDRMLYPNGVCFHCQQCVEKYLKAFLTAQDQKPARIHDLVVLGTESADYAPEIAEYYSDFVTLSAFAVMVRYPEKDADAEEAEEALEAMERARSALRVVLGLEEQPGEEEADEETDTTSNGAARADQS